MVTFYCCIRIKNLFVVRMPRVLTEWTHDSCVDDEDGGNNVLLDELTSSVANDFQFALPKVPKPEGFVSRAYADASTKKLMSFKKGTTTLAFKFQGGIMVAVDSRASMGGFISTQNCQKMIQITDYIVGTLAGGAADCAFWERYLSKLCRIHELRNGEKMTVAHASKLLANIFYSYHGYGLSCGIMIAGYDQKQKSFGLYLVDDCGERTKGNLFSIGSGSLYAYGVLDKDYRYDMSVDEARELAKRAIFHATHRDGGSGGLVRVRHVTSEGVKILDLGQDVSELYDEYNMPR